MLSNTSNKNKRITQTLNKVSTIVANSNFTKSLIKKLIIPQVNVAVIYPGAADLKALKENKVVEIKGSPIILTLARLEKRKGHAFIINSIKKLLTEFSDLKYIIAGSGPEEKNLKQLVKENNLQNNVLFVGNINDNQKKYIFEKTDLMIMPTIDETKNNSIEGFGIAYLEAAFFSVPSIASNVGGTPEAVLDNITGKIIKNIGEIDNSIRELLINDKYRKELGEKAKNRAEKEFNWDFISNNYLSLINTIVKK